MLPVYILLVILLLLVLVLLLKAASISKGKLMQNQEAQALLPSETALQNFSSALKIASLTHPEDPSSMFAVHQLLRERYPLLHQKLRLRIVNQYSLLFFWEGKDQALKPDLYIAHQDVVPVEASTLQQWKYPPFSGAIAEGFIWGRGALDNKIGLVALCEAVENLLTQGFKPNRSLYLAFGHDEEVCGPEGAKSIAALLKAEGVALHAVFDEGLFVLKNAIKGIKQPVAYVATSEKGSVNVELIVKQAGGHASTPPKENAVDLLAKSLLRIKRGGSPVVFGKSLHEMLLRLAPHMPFVSRLFIANLWFWPFKYLLIKSLAKQPKTNALLRSTQVPTQLKASPLANILAQEAKAVLNCRIIPGESKKELLQRIQGLAGPWASIQELGLSRESVAASSSQHEAFARIEKVTNTLYPSAIVCPAIMIAATDSSHYQDIAEGLYRFLPIQLEDEDLRRFHGVNERISIENFGRSIAYYEQLMRLG